MSSRNTVETADVFSRKRAILLSAAGIIFVAVQLITRPIHSGPSGETLYYRMNWWAVNAIVLMLMLVTRLQGGLLNRREIRELINDDVSREHHKRAVIGGFWVAMTTAMGIYFIPALQNFSAREAVYLIVTAAVGFAILEFCYLELRAHRGE